ncbi:MAG: hypothetical protein LBR28_01180 [Bacteroidales bacterium]|jgi:hypothetical protein|nr:hypothetical protein [Bacteroidales bacterium]
MKKTVLTAVLLIVSIALYGQKDVTKFLGIPVDGTKAEMIQKLKAKGYTSSTLDKDVLVGEFNGRDVNIHVATNNNKVWRIAVIDVLETDERQIKIKFNNLCKQFENNKNYVSLLLDQTLSDEEKISYEMTVHAKQYQAVFYQEPANVDTAAMTEEFNSFLLTKYTEEELANPTEEMKSKMNTDLITYMSEKLLKKTVWFTIVEDYGKYSIIMFYDNKYNQASGDDL